MQDNRPSKFDQFHISKVASLVTKSKKRKLLWFTAGAIIFLSIATLGFYKTAVDILKPSDHDNVQQRLASQDWKEYKSSEIGFTISYPSSWPEPEVNNLISGVEINFKDALKVKSESAVFKEIFGNRIYRVGDKEGKVVVSETGEGTIETKIYFPMTDQKEVLIFTYEVKIDDEETQNTIDYMLSTLKLEVK